MAGVTGVNFVGSCPAGLLNTRRSVRETSFVGALAAQSQAGHPGSSGVCGHRDRAARDRRGGGRVIGEQWPHGHVGSNNGQGILLPTGQRINPVGTRLLVNTGRILSSAISPNGKYLAALSWNDFTGYLTMINLKTDTVIQTVGDYPGPYIGDETVAADGPLWSADGTTLWVPQT